MKKYIALASIILLTASAVLFFVFSHQPSKGKIEPSKNDNKSSVPQSKAEIIETAYFRAPMPVGFIVKSNTENATPETMIQVVATKPQSQGEQIAITLGTLPNDALAGVSSYNLRVKNPDTYLPVEYGGLPANSPTFHSDNGTNYEVTIFLSHASLYAAVTVSGISSDASNINQALESIVGNWQWH